VRGVGGVLSEDLGVSESNVKTRGKSCSPAPADWGGVNVNAVAATLLSPRPLTGVRPANADLGVSG
jgi:hypothetical protein